MIANTLEVAVVGGYPPADRALDSRNCQYPGLLAGVEYEPWHPPPIVNSSGQPHQVLLLGQGLRLKPPHLAGAGGVMV